MSTFRVEATITYDDSSAEGPPAIRDFQVECHPDGGIPVGVVEDVIAFLAARLVNIQTGRGEDDRVTLSRIIQKVLLARSEFREPLCGDCDKELSGEPLPHG